MKKISYLLTTLLVGLTLVLISCDKEDPHQDCDCNSNDGMQMRMAMQADGYTEVEINPMEKVECYFEEWDKIIMTPVSGLFEYYNQNNTWVASIDFGDGSCDQWGTKTWDIDIFPDYPEGSMEFSLFE
tara:strand:- start:401 stop:784 length:384 start_codon:yes stop_codon:yes gene_type:complete